MARLDKSKVRIKITLKIKVGSKLSIILFPRSWLFGDVSDKLIL